ncbi:MAG: molecular chaperone DjlA [Cryomorphaceae bacterium BACL29 MAG-121220-bin8]|jgi:DnaJ like chaperone protein|nr:MAG: molecular chaperone DjlA [Cryomorphaceae bacterium BACL29 MAG-121220-bin8]
MSKWLLALIGYSFFRFPGAIIGYFLGSITENISFNKFKNTNLNSISTQEFELNLLALASVVIKADGKVTKQELDFVRAYFVSAYGKERANATFKIFNDSLKNIEISPLKISALFNSALNYESRIQVIHFLFGIAKADGKVSTLEIKKLLEFSNLLRLSYADFLSIKAMFINEVGGAYRILEIEKSATNQQIKRAYKDLAKKHHPDKVQHLGTAYVKAAKDKFQKIQEAYERIKQERGF